MKTKNCRVRVADIHHGKIIYVSHPFCGIEKLTVLSKPYFNWLTKSLFFEVKTKHGRSSRSICDAGIANGEGYNNRRTFTKLTQAKEWAEKMSKDPQVIARYLRHEQDCAEMDDCYDEEDWINL